MCGIAGISNLSKNSFFVDEGSLLKMQTTLSHRGPDSHGIWVDKNKQLGFAHTRLSIVDLSNTGHQPMLDAQQSVVITFNGEIYNHAIIKSELIKLGYKFIGNSDTETIIYAYKQWGIDCIKKFEGIFAFALYDIEKKELYLIRDRIGVKPLYFSIQENILSFASEIKALWQLPWNNKSFNMQAVSHYLTYMASPAPLTLYNGIYKLPPSYYLKVSQNNNLEFIEWYDPLDHVTNKFNNSQEDWIIDQLDILLENAVKKRLMSDVPVGIFLSGGIDSSLMTAYASKYINNLNTYNISFDDGADYNEREYARKVSKIFNTNHHETVISEKEAFDFFQKMVYHQDEPLGDCVCIPLYYVSKLLKDSGATVVLVGEGSDELFCGYKLYAQYLNLNKWLSKYDLLTPDFVKKIIFKLFSSIFAKNYRRVDLLHNWSLNRSIFFGGAIAYPEFFKKDFLSQNMKVEIDPVIKKIFPNMAQDFDSYKILEYYFDKFKTKLPKGDFFDSITYLELKHRIAELLLMRVDKMTMGCAVEGREPFLDHDLIEFAFKIPQNLKYKDNITKYILKKVAQKYLPEDIIYRKKVGFAAPTSKWFKSGKYFKPYLLDTLNKKSVFAEFIDFNKIKELHFQTSSGKANYADQLWVIQNLLACENL